MRRGIGRVIVLDASRRTDGNPTVTLDPRRSTGERELHHPAGQSVLLPKDPAFHPDGEGLAWRCGKLSA